MKMLTIITLRQQWEWLGSLFQSVRNFVRNIWFYRRVLWDDQPWDQIYIYELLRRKLQQMIALDGIGQSWPQKQEKMHLCVLLLDRLIEEDYVLGIPPRGWSKPWEYGDYMVEQDVRLLFETMRKHIRCWWD